MHAGFGPGVSLLGSRTVPASATTTYESHMENFILFTDVHLVSLPVAKLDEASVSWSSQWVERQETNWNTPAPGRQDGMGAEGRKGPSKRHQLERGSDLRRDRPGNRNSYSPQKGPGGQRLWGVTKLEGSVDQNNEVKRGVSSHVPWDHPEGSGDPSRKERSG